jgi:hypothetical protein
MWEPRRLTTLWDFTACYRDSFTILPFLPLLIISSAGPSSQPAESTTGNIHYTPLNTTLFPAGGATVQGDVCHLQVRFQL